VVEIPNKAQEGWHLATHSVRPHGKAQLLSCRSLLAGFDSRTLSCKLKVFSMGSFGGHFKFFSRLVMLLACLHLKRRFDLLQLVDCQSQDLTKTAALKSCHVFEFMLFIFNPRFSHLSLPQSFDDFKGQIIGSH
jgi:hypothetical protein